MLTVWCEEGGGGIVADLQPQGPASRRVAALVSLGHGLRGSPRLAIPLDFTGEDPVFLAGGQGGGSPIARILTNQDGESGGIHPFTQREGHSAHWCNLVTDLEALLAMPLDFNGKDPVLPARGQGGDSPIARILTNQDGDREVFTPSFKERPIPPEPVCHPAFFH